MVPRKIVAIGNQSHELTKAGEEEKKKIFEGGKREQSASYINYNLDDEDLENA